MQKNHFYNFLLNFLLVCNYIQNRSFQNVVFLFQEGLKPRCFSIQKEKAQYVIYIFIELEN